MNLRSFFAELTRRNVVIPVVAWWVIALRLFEIASPLVRLGYENSKKVRKARCDIRTKDAAGFREPCGSYW
jgi:hypothetical protein